MYTDNEEYKNMVDMLHDVSISQARIEERMHGICTRMDFFSVEKTVCADEFKTINEDRNQIKGMAKISLTLSGFAILGLGYLLSTMG